MGGENSLLRSWKRSRWSCVGLGRVSWVMVRGCRRWVLSGWSLGALGSLMMAFAAGIWSFGSLLGDAGEYTGAILELSCSEQSVQVKPFFLPWRGWHMLLEFLFMYGSLLCV